MDPGVVGVGLLSAVLWMPALPGPGEDNVDPNSYSTMIAYGTPIAQESDVPDGFQPIFTQHVGRHGSRAIHSASIEKRVLELWQEAEEEDELTVLGAQLGPDVRAMQEAMKELGYGNLSRLGAQEQRGIGARAAERLASVFEDSGEGRGVVEIVTSGRDRAVDSADNFVIGLKSSFPDIEAEDPDTDEDLLHFDTENEEYEDFIDDDGPTGDAVTETRELPRVTRQASVVLRRLYTSEFVDSIDDPVSEVRDLYKLYQVEPGMRYELDVAFDKYFSPAQASTFAELDDARYFYQRGPSIAGRDGSYKAAEVIVKDFFVEIDDHLDGSNEAAVFRFAHAEEMVPLAGLSSNMQWDLYQNETGDVAVTMLYNEQPTPFHESCQAVEPDSVFYQLDELKDCLGELTGSDY